MGNLSNTTINGVSYEFKDAGAARQSHSHTKSQITDFPTSMPASDVPAWAKASSKPSYTQDEVSDGSTYKRVTSTEKNTWNSKGTYSKPSGGIPKTDLASAVQTSLGLADGALQHTTVSGSPDLDTYLTTGVYHITTSTATHAPTTNHATLFVDATVGTPYQIFKPDNVDSPWYTRHRSGSSWTAWAAMKFTDTTYSAATTSAAGLMSATDKSKLDGIASGATKTTVDSALSSTSTNPVQNKVINSALAGKASTAVATTSAAGLMSAADKTKLNGLPNSPSGYTKFSTVAGAAVVSSDETGGFINYGHILFVHDRIYIGSGTSSLRLFNISLSTGDTYPSGAPLLPIPEEVSSSMDKFTLHIPVYDSTGALYPGAYLDLSYNYYKSSSRLRYTATLWFDTAPTSNVYVLLHYSYMGKLPTTV